MFQTRNRSAKDSTTMFGVNVRIPGCISSSHPPPPHCGMRERRKIHLTQTDSYTTANVGVGEDSWRDWMLLPQKNQIFKEFIVITVELTCSSAANTKELN
jgi:hypothetical protein